MTGLLLDTNVVLFSIYAPEQIGPRQRATIDAAERYVSPVAAIEIAIKLGAGKLDLLPPQFQTDFSRAFEAVVDGMGAELLPIRLNHIDRLSRLPLFHRDPWDRLLIAQALEEDLTVATRDRLFSAYPGLDVLSI